MKATIRLTIDLEVRTKRKLIFFWHRMYAKATFEGEMDVGEIRIGEVLSLTVFNDIPTQFVVKSIERTPVPRSSEVRNLIRIYHRTESMQFTKDGCRHQTLAECVERLNTSISQRLSAYGLVPDPTESKVGTEPTYLYVPSNVGVRVYL